MAKHIYVKVEVSWDDGSLDEPPHPEIVPSDKIRDFIQSEIEFFEQYLDDLDSFVPLSETSKRSERMRELVDRVHDFREWDLVDPDDILPEVKDDEEKPDLDEIYKEMIDLLVEELEEKGELVWVIRDEWDSGNSTTLTRLEV